MGDAKAGWLEPNYVMHACLLAIGRPLHSCPAGTTGEEPGCALPIALSNETFFFLCLLP